LTLLDANALAGLLLGEPARLQVAELLRNGDCAVPAACLGEVVDNLMRKHQIPQPSMSERLGPLLDETLTVLAVDQRTAWRAGELRAAHYHHVDSALSLADCLLLASTKPGDLIATSDRAVETTAQALGIGLIPLLDSNGERPSIG